MIARLGRLEGIEHATDCLDQAKPLRFRGSSTAWDGDQERSTARFSCSSCSLDVEVHGSLDVGPPAGRD